MSLEKCLEKYRKIKTKDELYKLYTVQGLSIREISEELGVSLGTVHKWLKKYDIHKKIIVGEDDE